MSSKTAKRSGPNTKRNEASWKVVQDKNKIKKKTRLALILLGIIILIILLGNFVKLTQTLFSPWQLSVGQAKNYIWNGGFNLNIVLKKDSDFSLISYNPKEKKVIILRIPQNTIVDVPSSFGKWQLRSVYDLAESNKKGSGVNLLKETIARLLGIPIDGFLDIGDLDETAFLRDNLILSLGSLSSIRGDLTLWEIIRFKMGTSSVRFDKVDKLDLLTVLDKGNLADGSEIYTADPVKVDSILKNLADPLVSEEHKTIAVFNATDKKGLASIASRMITNMGGSVIITSNAPQRAQNSLLIGEKSHTLERIKQAFKLDCKDCDKINASYEGIISSRAQINLILGEDF